MVREPTPVPRMVVSEAALTVDPVAVWTNSGEPAEPPTPVPPAPPPPTMVIVAVDGATRASAKSSVSNHQRLFMGHSLLALAITATLGLEVLITHRFVFHSPISDILGFVEGFPLVDV